MNYKEKYLKYKNKYLKSKILLEKELINENLSKSNKNDSILIIDTFYHKICDKFFYERFREYSFRYNIREF